MKFNSYQKIVELYHLFNDSDELLKTFYANDYAIPFKDLTFFPVTVDLHYYFHLLAQSLLVPHKTSGDLKAIKMDYLKFICYLALEKKDYEHILKLSELLLIVLRKPKEYKDKQGQTKATIDILLEKGEINIEGKIYSGKDFDKIRKIILEQNAIELPDETLNPEVVKAFKEVEEFKLKQCQLKLCSFEDQINVVVAVTSYRRDEILKMTIRSFNRLFERVNMLINYKVQCNQAPYMKAEDQKKIKHYLIDNDSTLKERMEQSFTDMDSFEKKIETK